jgi:hypothetical protein
LNTGGSAVASRDLLVAFYAEMRGHKLDHAVKCALTHERVRLISLSSYDKKGASTPPQKETGEDGLADLYGFPRDCTPRTAFAIKSADARPPGLDVPSCAWA